MSEFPNKTPNNQIVTKAGQKFILIPLPDDEDTSVYDGANQKPFNTKKVRQEFLRKVYGILTVKIFAFPFKYFLTNFFYSKDTTSRNIFNCIRNHTIFWRIVMDSKKSLDNLLVHWSSIRNNDYNCLLSALRTVISMQLRPSLYLYCIKIHFGRCIMLAL